MKLRELQFQQHTGNFNINHSWTTLWRILIWRNISISHDLNIGAHYGCNLIEKHNGFSFYWTGYSWHLLGFVIMYMTTDNFTDIKHRAPHPKWLSKSCIEGLEKLAIIQHEFIKTWVFNVFLEKFLRCILITWFHCRQYGSTTFLTVFCYDSYWKFQ